MHLRVIPATPKTCACGVVFRAANPAQFRCTPQCGRTSQIKNAARTVARASHTPTFIGVDGEGVTRKDGVHDYVLLSIGEESLHHDGERLQFDDVATFLWEQFSGNQDACFVGYYLGYDFTQWLRTLPQDRVEMLVNSEARKRTKSGGNPTPFPVYFGKWEFDLLGMKRFKLRREGEKPWLHICDVGPFFQQPFASAISDKWQTRTGEKINIVHDDEREVIERGKARRATAKFDKEMIRYNVAENRVLARMMETMATGFQDMGVSLQRDEWYGPGQVAQKWMDQHSSHPAKKLKEKADKDDVFRGAIEGARCAYFGGWFETFAHGHVGGRSWEYDISSAYPHIHSNLPCLLHGNWRRVEGGQHRRGADLGGYENGCYVLVRASVAGSNQFIGSMMHRDRQGKINRPDNTSGWYWEHELAAAVRAGLVSDVRRHEGFVYEPCKCKPPMHDLRGLYDQRLSVGKSTPQGRGLKLTYNSAYGKTAQSIGTPKHANAIHASLITAGCRTMILDAIATHPKGAAAVLMIATDGIYFDSPHPGLQAQQTGELGGWEETAKDNLTIFLPGVYWDDKSREGRKTKVAKLKSRGVSGADLMERLDELDARFDRMLNEPIPFGLLEGVVPPDWWATLTLPIRFSMVSPKQALQRGKWELCGVVTQDGTRDLNSHPRHKRGLVSAPTIERPYIHTFTPQNIERVASTPYSKQFGMELADMQAADYVMTPEGDAISEAYEIIRG